MKQTHTKCLKLRKTILKKRIIAILAILSLYCCIFVACNPDGSNSNYYTVTFDSQGGSSVESQSVLAGNPARTPTSPTRDGYIFQGWYKSSDSNAERWNFSTDRVNSDITLYAFWAVDTTQPTDTLVFERNVTGTGYIVTGDNGQSAKIVIPAEYEGLPVLEIGESAFAYSRHTSDILSVTIPDSVTAIGRNAFHNQHALVTVNIGAGSELVSIGNNAFSGNSSLVAIYLPCGFTTLGDSVFNNCGALNTITIASDNRVFSSEGNNLIEIATQTLIRGSNNSVIPDGVKVIASAAFRKSTITQLVIPSTVVSIENYVIQDSGVEEIIYRGTEEQWQAIEKAKLWNIGKTDIQIKFEPEQEITKMYVTVYGYKLEVALADNSSVKALVELLKQGDITYTANDYGGFEKVGYIGHTLPTNNSQITTEPGDVVLYQGNQICILVGSNSWSYTRIGKISGYSTSQLKGLIGTGKGSAEITLSLD